MRVFVLAAATTALLAFPSVAFSQHAPPAAPAAEPIRLSVARPIASEVAGQPGPVRIDACFSDGRSAEGLTLVHHAVRITNGGERPITAVRVRFAFYDAFGDVRATRTSIAELRLDPGRTADRVNLAELSDGGPPARIVCSIDAIRYDDGTIARTQR